MLVSPPPAKPGDRVAILSPSFAAPAVFPDVHEIRRHRTNLGREPRDYSLELGCEPVHQSERRIRVA